MKNHGFSKSSFLSRVLFRLLVVMGLVVSMTVLQADDTSKGIQKYREMLANEGNPAELAAAKGEELWRTPRGPNNVSLETCDLGLGAGKVKGAYAQMPRYFKDTKRVEDLESRLMTCMEKIQGIDKKTTQNEKFLQGEKESIAHLVAYIVTESQGQKIAINLHSPQVKKMYRLGEKAFYFRAGTMDFSCATCHGDKGLRIRLQELPDLRTHEGAAEAWGTWPAYRVSNSEFWTMQHRLHDCFRQQRFPEPIYGSDATIALSVYLAGLANGGVLKAPGLKR